MTGTGLRSRHQRPDDAAVLLPEGIDHRRCACPRGTVRAAPWPAPSQRELAQLAQASNFATRAAKAGTLDAAQLHAGWADKLARTLGMSLASVAPSVWHGRDGRADPSRLQDALTGARDAHMPAPDTQSGLRADQAVAAWSAEPEPVTDAQRGELTMAAGEQTPELGRWIKDLAAAHRTFPDRLADRQSLTIPSQDPDYGGLGQAFPPWPGPGNDAILQPPKPEIRPSRLVLERAAERDVDWEAAD